MNSAFKIANGGGRYLAYMVSKYVHFQQFCRCCPENFELQLPDPSNDHSLECQCTN